MACMKPVLFSFVWLTCLILPTWADEKKKEAEKHPANRLAKESSPYLLQHAHNPVDWYPWGSEAFEKAKKEKKLVFLSIGYSSCHWCHVMEKESFEDKDVAEILNKHFVCIKVDREERPDIDEIYMTALHTMRASGGWPLSMFLMPDGKPIIGGTYWPKEDREIEGEKLNGFKSILKVMIDLNQNKAKELQEQADHIANLTDEQLSRAGRLANIVNLEQKLVNEVVDSYREELDPVHGGIGSKTRNFRGTKFPMVQATTLLLTQAHRTKDKELTGLIDLTLEKMAYGGIYDHLGGGFHRYSTERTWTVPHFEKMLYDNAQIVELYSIAYRQNPKPLYKHVVQQTLEFIRREMTSAQGGFYSALDADSNDKEGEFYVWTPEEISKVLTDETKVALFRAVYGVSGKPNFEEKYFILKLSRPMSEIAKEQKQTEAELEKQLSAIREQLRLHREKRVKPFLDTKVLTAWNGQMIAAYALAGQVFQERSYIETAAKAADFLLSTLRTKEGRLLRSYAMREGKPEAKLNAYLDDYAFLVHGLLNLHDASGDKKWLDEAKKLTDTMITWHGDGEKGGYFYTSSDHEKLFARPKDYYDGAQPSANGMATRNLLRLSTKLNEPKYTQQAVKSIKQFAAMFKANPTSVPLLATSLQIYLDTNPDQGADKEAAKKETPSKILKSDSVVKMEAKASEVADDGKQTITITLTIDKPWHLYANPTGNPTIAEAATTVTIKSNGKEVKAQIEYPKGEKIEDAVVGDYQIYAKEVTIKASLKRNKDDGPLEIAAKVQACNDKTCLQGSTLKTTIK